MVEINNRVALNKENVGTKKFLKLISVPARLFRRYEVPIFLDSSSPRYKTPALIIRKLAIIPMGHGLEIKY